MKKFLKLHWPELIFFSFWIIYFALFWSRAVFYDAIGNLWAGHVNIWGDWAAHFTMGNAMAVRGLFIKSPFLLNANFSYPFVADYISSLLMVVGIPMVNAFLIPSFFFSILIVAALYYFYTVIFQSKRVAILASCIFLFNGGLGFYFFFQDIIHSAQPLTTFLMPIHEYTRIDEQGIKWISVIDSMIIPQRSFPLGFSCAIIALALVYQIFFRSKKNSSPKKEKIYFVLIGLLLGFLPIIHTHSFLATFLFLFCWSVSDLVFLSPEGERITHLKKWVAIAATTTIIAVPLINYYFLHNVNNGFLQWHPGWMSSEYDGNWLTFTWKNWGITPILALGSLILFFKGFHKKTLGILLLPSFLLFVLSNLFLFQPWSWDNTKLLVWFLLGSSGLISYFLIQFYQWKSKNVLTQYLKGICIVALVFVVIASGVIDAYRIQRISLHTYVMYGAEDVSLANWVKKNTDPHSIWLTGTPHNHWLFNLTGRQAVMTYPGWLWTQGYDYIPTMEAVRGMYAGLDNTFQMLEGFHIDYVVIGTNELLDANANQSFFDKNFPVVYQLGETKIYKVSN